MKKFFYFFLLLILATGISKTASAGTNVEISGNGEGSTSRVSINNTLNSSSTNYQNGQTNINTNIRIKTNGEVKEYSGTGDQNVHVESSDGKNSVTIKSVTATNNASASPSSSPSQSPSASPSASVSAEVKGESEFNLGEMVKEFFKSISELFKN